MSNSCSPWAVALRTPLSMRLLGQEYQNGIAIFYSRGSSRPRNRPCVSCVSCTGRFSSPLGPLGSPRWASRSSIMGVQPSNMHFLSTNHTSGMGLVGPTGCVSHAVCNQANRGHRVIGAARKHGDSRSKYGNGLLGLEGNTFLPRPAEQLQADTTSQDSQEASNNIFLNKKKISLRLYLFHLFSFIF